MRGADRCPHPAPDALQHRKGDQGTSAPGEAAKRRANGEHDKREREGPLRAEAIADPAGSRNPNRQADQVSGDDPLKAVSADSEVATKRRKRNVTDRHVTEITNNTFTKLERQQHLVRLLY